jgi:hypothetical protein
MPPWGRYTRTTVSYTFALYFYVKKKIRRKSLSTTAWCYCNGSWWLKSIKDQTQYRAHISGRILIPYPDPNSDADQLRLHLLDWQGGGGSSTTIYCTHLTWDSFNLCFNVWHRVQGLTRSFRRSEMLALYNTERECGHIFGHSDRFSPI